jgi:SPP1 family holin
MNRESTKAIINLVIEAILFLNAILTAAGKNPLPLDTDAITVTLTSVFAGISAVYCWWKNQNITVEAQTAQKIADEMKADRELIGGEENPLGDSEGDDF